MHKSERVIETVENPSIWQGGLIFLRAVEPDDWQVFYAWDTGIDSTFGRFDGTPPFPASKEAMMRRTTEWATTKPERDEFRWMIENGEGQVVGTIHTHTCNPRAGTLRYGVAIRREHWRRGYAAEAIRLILRYYFDELRYQKANVEIHAFNEASLALHRKLGFLEEGRLRQIVYTEGKYFDQVLLGITAEEFRQSQG